MKITVPVELDLDDPERAILRGLFNCTDDELGNELSPYVRAAGHEYVDMFTGSGPITTATDVKERRLVGIMLRGPQTFPTAALIARLFKVPVSSASALIRNVSAKHEVKVSKVIDAELHALVAGSDENADDGKYYMLVHDNGLVRLLNARLAQATEAQSSIVAVKDTANKYSMDVGTRNYLLGVLAPAKVAENGG